jgi:hypothetical protein
LIVDQVMEAVLRAKRDAAQRRVCAAPFFSIRFCLERRLLATVVPVLASLVLLPVVFLAVDGAARTVQSAIESPTLLRRECAARTTRAPFGPVKPRLAPFEMSCFATSQLAVAHTLMDASLLASFTPVDILRSGRTERAHGSDREERRAENERRS